MQNVELIDITIDEKITCFDCENPSLNNYLINNAYYEHIMCFSNTKLIKIDNNLVGYFTLELKQVIVPIDYDDNLYPVVCLKCLAIDKNYKNQGVGSNIIDYVLELSKGINEDAGCRGLYIDALLERVDWYKNRGFILLGKVGMDPTIPMLIDFRDNELVADYFEI